MDQEWKQPLRIHDFDTWFAQDITIGNLDDEGMGEDEDTDDDLGLESEEQGPVLSDEESEFASMNVGGHALAGTPTLAYDPAVFIVIII